MPPKLRGKWALGITPRNFTWIIKDKLAVCERPGGYGDNHRRVRRQEEIIWMRENNFDLVISIIAAPHNLHAYQELSMPHRHRPLGGRWCRRGQDHRRQRDGGFGLREPGSG